MTTRGPYASWQRPAPCGCYYPDVTRIKDDPLTGQRTLFCLFHGEYTTPWDVKNMLPKHCAIPDKKWRSKKREELRNGLGRLKVLAVYRRTKSDEDYL